MSRKYWCSSLTGLLALALAPYAFEQGAVSEVASSMSAADQGVELMRETLGLAIVTAWMAVLAVTDRLRVTSLERSAEEPE